MQMMLPATIQERQCDAQTAYRFSRAAGYALLGTEEGFVLLLEDLADERHVALYGDVRIAQNVSFEVHAAEDALAMAQSLNAEFRVVGDLVQCQVDDAIVVGGSYAEAAMKAVIYRWEQKQAASSSNENRGDAEGG